MFSLHPVYILALFCVCSCFFQLCSGHVFDPGMVCQHYLYVLQTYIFPVLLTVFSILMFLYIRTSEYILYSLFCKLSLVFWYHDILYFLFCKLSLAFWYFGFSVLRKNARITISRKRHFRSPKQKNENTLQYKVPPKTWENSPQKPLLATRKWFFGHCYVQNVRFLKIP